MAGRRPRLPGPGRQADTAAMDSPSPAAPSLLPCLKEANWEGRPHTVCRALCPAASASSPHIPWLAFGFDHPHSLEFVNRDWLASLASNAQELEARALANLRARPATWQPLDVTTRAGGPLQVLACSDDFFAAERILDPAFMKQAQQHVGASRLFVGIPRRGLLLAIPGDLDNALVREFRDIVATEFSSGESAAISPALFELRVGALFGAVADEVLAAPAAPGRAPQAAPRAAAAPVKNAPAAAPEQRPTFYWWTSLPSWFRLGIGLLIGLVILARFLIDFAISLLP